MSTFGRRGSAGFGNTGDRRSWEILSSSDKDYIFNEEDGSATKTAETEKTEEVKLPEREQGQ